MNRLTTVVQSAEPRQALADFMTWYAAHDAALGNSAALSAALDTAQFLALDPFADSTALAAFNSAVNGTEFYFSPYDRGRVYFDAPPSANQTGSSAHRSGDGSTHLARAPISTSVKMSQFPAQSSGRAVVNDGEPDEPTEVIYVNGIFTLDESLGDGAGSATKTMYLLQQQMTHWPRFGTGMDLRENVHVSHFYNHSESQTVHDYKVAHACESKAARGLRLLQWLHVLKRLAECKAVPFALHVLDSDLLEAYEQIRQLQGSHIPLTPDAFQLASVISGHHSAGQHVILVGHSQGNLLIAQALQVLPSPGYDRKPLNVGNGCTAVMSLASPLGSSAFTITLEPRYFRGLIVSGDVLLQLRGGLLDNDFPRIHTRDGDAVPFQPSFVAKLQKGLDAHYVDENYLLTPSSEERLKTEMTMLSDECSVGTFEVTSNPDQMIVQDKARIGINLRSRTGAPLLGRAFQGGSEVAFVNGADSTVLATGISDLPTTVPIRLYNTAKIQASLRLDRITKRAMEISITYTPSPTAYYTYTINVRRADQGPFTFINAFPLNPTVVNSEAWFSSDSVTTELVANVLQENHGQGPDTQWEVRTYNGPTFWDAPMANVIAIDTIAATAGPSFKAASAGAVIGKAFVKRSAESDALSTLIRQDSMKPATEMLPSRQQLHFRGATSGRVTSPRMDPQLAPHRIAQEHR